MAPGLVYSSSQTEFDPSPSKSLGSATSPCADPSLRVSEYASEKTKSLWALHGYPYSNRYSDPKLVSVGALIERNANVYQGETAFLYPTSQADDSYKRLTWDQFHITTDTLARRYGNTLRSEILRGRETRTQPVVALLGGGTTIEYFATQIALLKLNLCMLLLADKNSTEATHNLLSKCNAVTVIVDVRNAAVDTHGVRKISMVEDAVKLGVSEAGFEDEGIEQLRFEDGNDQWERRSFILHSSGSTGLPKPITHTNRSMMLSARMYRLYPDFHVENWFLLFPLYGDRYLVSSYAVALLIYGPDIISLGSSLRFQAFPTALYCHFPHCLGRLQLPLSWMPGET